MGVGLTTWTRNDSEREEETFVEDSEPDSTTVYSPSVDDRPIKELPPVSGISEDIKESKKVNRLQKGSHEESFKRNIEKKRVEERTNEEAEKKERRLDEKMRLKMNDSKRCMAIAKTAYGRTMSHFSLPENSKFETVCRKAIPIERIRKTTKELKIDHEDVLTSRHLKFITPINANPFRTGLTTMIHKAYNGLF